MAKAKEVDGVFKFLSPSEIDTRVKAIISNFALNGGHNTEGWMDEDIMIRRQVIWEYIRQGLSVTNIKSQLMDRWGIKNSCAYNYIKDAMNALVSDSKEFADMVRDKQIERLEHIATEAIDAYNYDTALKAYDQINRLSGLYTEKKEVDLTGDITFSFGGGVEE